mgnify:FL=1
MRIMTASRQSELEQSNAKLLQEVDRLTRENTELLKLRQDNIRLQERNVQLAAELSVRSKPELSSSVSDLSDVREHAGGVPGDSYPAVAASLDDIESDVNTDGEDTDTADNDKKKPQEPEYLLQKLRKGGNRMDQIKRQLVVQRGSIVAALKILAQARSSSSLSSYKSTEQSPDSGDSSVSEEKDRVLVSITASGTSTSQCKLCPMCEAMFPLSAEEEFEQHVMDHFSYDSDPDTLQYLAPDADPSEEIQTDHL